jgi:hypothetical protein|tara:strand:+ start:497 stop:706 length:210 start_codon:yes stop_codon:yes gene_type:complete
MIITVHFTGNQFVAYDEQGNEVKDRDILDQISFMQFPGFKSSFQVEVDKTDISANIQPLNININFNTEK